MSKSELVVMKDNENKLLGRREVTIQLKHSQGATPTRSEVRQRIAGNFNVDQELIRITRMVTKTNTWMSVCYADIYTSKEAAERLTSKHLALRDLPKEEKEKIKAEKKKASKAKSGKK